ncbi:MAG: thioredoxin domain-containing protein [Planctomycetes bacterium]|nr:thioredoxin domain-containing protein [Planctomycetota bacterium]
MAVLWLGVACRPISAVGDSEDGKVDPVTTETKHKHTNRLSKATSPYLLQHAHNPVDWYEWGPEALEKAKKEDKPIFLSIGYSACHWCHVMEHESFEIEAVATIMNEHFVSIKVDREERPDIDEIYMQATVTMTGRGGWPMSVFLSSDGVPFHAGTYYPRRQFEGLLQSIARSWREDRDGVMEQGSRVNARLQQWAKAPSGSGDLIPFEAVSRTAGILLRYFDMNEGGMSGGGSNKFPPSLAMELMLREYIRGGESKLLEAVELTLTKMARGGIYDHLGGGICRYSTDTKWLVPHFEKMLYDQGLVSSIYVDGYLVTKNPLYAEAARGIFDYVIRDLQSPEGGFYSTRDADSEGMEGKFYIWTVEQVTDVLGEEDAKLFCAYFDVTETGNWFESRGHAPKGPKNILNIQRDVETVAKLHGIEPDDLEKRLARMRVKMFEARAKRVPPALDDKILTGWNGLMIAGLAKGGRAFNEPRYTEAAARAADFVLDKLRRDGHLLRTHRKGQSRLTGYLSDYAFFIEGLINLYEATFDVRWLDEAVALTDDSIRRYYDAEGGGFFFTANDAETLIARTKDPNDGAVPSGNSVHAMNLLRLALLVDNKDYRAKAESIFRAFASLAARSPTRFERLLCAVDFYGGRPKEIAIVGSPDAPETRAMLDLVFGSYRPNKIVASADGDIAPSKLARRIPLLKNKRRIDGKTTAYVCENYTCKKPVTSAVELAQQLAER